jgi:glycosyltransferase involved in cell wall biosynthesis
MSPAQSISVAMCTYNGARFVGEQLASILEQTSPPAELVVADDGSSDGTLEIVGGIADAHGVQPTVLPGDSPLGVTANFERAVSATTQPIVALSDQDDRWHPGRLEDVAARFDADPGLLLLHTDARLIDDAGAPLGRTLFESLEVGAHELAAEQSGDAFSAFLRRNLATGATVVFRRTLLESALPFPRDWVHDEWLAIVAAAVGRVQVVRDATIDYRQHGANEIGVAEPTLGRKLRRILEPRGTRNAVLAGRFGVLAARLEALGDAVPDRFLRAARAKARFESRRAAMPANRLRRVGAVLRLAWTGDYRRFASRGRADILRDLVQPA